MSSKADTNKGIFEIISIFISNYNDKTPKKIQLIDLFMVFSLLTAAVQFGYVCLVGTFPFNSFLAGFIACIGAFVLTGTKNNFFSHLLASLRKQVVLEIREKEFKNNLPERAYADYILCGVLLFFTAVCFMG